MATIIAHPRAAGAPEFEAWIDGAPTPVLPTVLAARAAEAIHDRLLIAIGNDVPEPASWATPLDAWRMLHWLYRGQVTISSPDVDLEALRPNAPGVDY